MAAYQRRLLILAPIGGPIVQVGQAPAPAGPHSTRGRGCQKLTDPYDGERRAPISTQKLKSGGMRHEEACQK
jgi:hypothetical protein